MPENALLDGDLHRRVLDMLSDGVYVVGPDRRVLYWNDGAARLTGFTAREVLGRRCMDNILNHVDDRGHDLCSVSCPLVNTMQDGERRARDVFLRHKNGQRVPVHVEVLPIRDDLGAIVGVAEVFSDNSLIQQINRDRDRLRELALLDELTQIGNRRFGDEQLATVFQEAHRYGVPFGVLFVDIDFFKRVNDERGHPVGDRVLAAVAATLANSVRMFDVICRWGGEEFLAIIKHVDSAQLGYIAEKMRFLVSRSTVIHDGQPVEVSVTIGGTLARPDDDPRSVVRRADNLLLVGKAAGRDRVIMG